MVGEATVEPSAEECIQKEKTVIGALAGAFERSIDDIGTLIVLATSGYMVAMGMVVPEWYQSITCAVVTYRILKTVK